MNYAEYFEMRRKVLHEASDAMEDASHRNEHKDKMSPPIADWPREYRKGWMGFDLSNKLREEVAEVLEKPTRQELGDVMWVCAMMLDQINAEDEKP